MNRFWIFLAVVVVGLGVLFVATKPKDDGPSAFTGDAAKIQSDDHAKNGKENNVTLIEYADFQCPACAQFSRVFPEAFNYINGKYGSSTLSLTYKYVRLRYIKI